MNEIWLPTTEPVGYEVSNLGNVRRIGSRTLLATHINSHGYITVTLSKQSKALRKTVHRLVCTAFLGVPPPDLPWVNHIDGDRSNNSVTNLEWTNPSLNALHAYRTLNRPKRPGGAAHYCAKLTEDDVREIRRLRTEGMSFSAIGDRYGVNRNTVKQIFTGRSWAHVT